MRMRASMVVLMMLLCGAAGAEEQKLPMDLPVYPGGESTMEINISNEDIMPMLQAFLPMAGGMMGSAMELTSTEEIASVFQDVRRIEFLQLNVTKPKVTDEQIADYYSRNLPKGMWSRIYWKIESGKQTVAVYSQRGTEELYGFRITSVKADGKTIKRIDVAKIEGKVGYTKLLSLAARIGVMAKGGKL